MGLRCRIAETVTMMRPAVCDTTPRLVEFGNDVVLFDQVRIVIGDEVHASTKLMMRDKVIVNVGCYLSAEGGLYIDEEVLIGPHAKILSAGHSLHGEHASIQRNSLTRAAIHIGAGAWIGAGATVLQGVSIGAGTVVGAGSVVTKSLPAYCVAVGNPARPVRYRDGHGTVRRRCVAWVRRLLRRFL
ncbi:MAG: acyltransferase [Burkholderiales bacterium]|nr:acyltransferase [Burkholderiales bacterium]